MKGAVVNNVKQLVDLYERALTEFNYEVTKLKNSNIIEYLKSNTVIFLEPDPYSGRKDPTIRLCVLNRENEYIGCIEMDITPTDDNKELVRQIQEMINKGEIMSVQPYCRKHYRTKFIVLLDKELKNTNGDLTEKINSARELVGTILDTALKNVADNVSKMFNDFNYQTFDWIVMTNTKISDYITLTLTIELFFNFEEFVKICE
jgi:hypothetical protein